MRAAGRTRQLAGAPGALRIIGGRWRGRRLPVVDAPGLRPTPDRVRETLFNWLQPVIAGARALDLFAGTGALGIEALSRGAGEVVFVERDPAVLRALQGNLERLEAAAAGRLVGRDACGWLAGPAPQRFELVFLDPPFGEEGLLETCCTQLAGGDWLAPGARVYLEAPARRGPPALPDGWALVRSKRAGDVGYHLARCP